MKNKNKLLLTLLFIFAVSCSTNDKHVIILAFSKNIHAVLYNDNSQNTQTAARTYIQKEDIATVSNSKTNEIVEEITLSEKENNLETIETQVLITEENNNDILVTTNVIEFDFDSYELKEQYDEGINELYTYLDNNKNIRLIIEGHTDNTGDSNYNISLSENRARVIFDKLVDKGIDVERISYIGYGSTRSSIFNERDRKCQFVVIYDEKEELEYKKANESKYIKLKR